MENGGAGTVVFKPDEVSVWKTMFGVGTRYIRVYGCIECQRLQLAVDFGEEDLRRYQQLEGGQTSHTGSNKLKLENAEGVIVE